MIVPVQVTLPCGWTAVLEDEPGSLLADIQHGLDGKDFFAEEWNKMMLALVGTSGRTLILSSSYFAQRFRHSLRSILEPNALTLKSDRALKPVFRGV